jgi:hypothetical protein
MHNESIDRVTKQIAKSILVDIERLLWENGTWQITNRNSANSYSKYQKIKQRYLK